MLRKSCPDLFKLAFQQRLEPLGFYCLRLKDGAVYVRYFDPSTPKARIFREPREARIGGSCGVNYGEIRQPKDWPAVRQGLPILAVSAKSPSAHTLLPQSCHRAAPWVEQFRMWDGNGIIGRHKNNDQTVADMVA